MTRCLITAGPTREHIDPVRFLSNGSSGRMGYALAAAAAARGWSVNLVSGPVAFPAATLAPALALAPMPASASLRVRHVISAEEMFAACAPLFAQCDVFIAVAAVCDYKPRAMSVEKTKKSKDAAGMTLELVPTIDILKTLAARKTPAQCVVGFAAETRDVENYARQKLVEKNLDWIVANEVGKPGIGMDAADNSIVMLSRAGARAQFGPAPKQKVAEFILTQISRA